MSKISVCVPTYCGASGGQSDILWMCLEAIRVRTCTNEPFDIVVVDDSGKKEHQEKSRVIAERFNARWIAHATNRGVAAAWNTLVRSTSTPYVALLNDDFFVSRGWIDALVYFLDRNPCAGSAGLYWYFCHLKDVPSLLSSPDATITPCHPTTKEFHPEYAVEHTGHEPLGRVMAPPGCGFGFTREKYDLIGGFDESLGKAGWEESDMGTALASKGFPAYILQWPACYTPMSATFTRCPELGRHVGASPRARYIQKWGAESGEVHRRYMSRIPFQTIQWMDSAGVERQEAITGEDGFWA